MFNIIDYVIQDRCSTKPKEPEAWVIMLNGEQLTLESGKSIWKKEAHAKSAFTLLIKDHAVSLYHDKHPEIKSWKEMEAIYDTEIQEMIRNGILKFVRIK